MSLTLQSDEMVLQFDDEHNTWHNSCTTSYKGYDLAAKRVDIPDGLEIWAEQARKDGQSAFAALARRLHDRLLECDTNLGVVDRVGEDAMEGIGEGGVEEGVGQAAEQGGEERFKEDGVEEDGVEEDDWDGN